MATKKETKEVAIVPQEDMSAEILISRAIDKGVDVGTMERLLAMRTQIKAEQAKEAFNRSMAAFQAECPMIEKTKPVHTRDGRLAYKYAPIESIVAQVNPYLKRHGFSYSTTMELKDKGVRVVCKVTHELGHSEESPMEVPFGTKTQVMSDSQVTAAASTFAKRYAFCNAFGILTGDEDVDGKSFDKTPIKDDAEVVVTYDEETPAPWQQKPKVVETIEDKVLKLKAEIKKFADSKVIHPLEGKDAYVGWVKAQTGLDLTDTSITNLEAINSRLNF